MLYPIDIASAYELVTYNGTLYYMMITRFSEREVIGATGKTVYRLHKFKLCNY